MQLSDIQKKAINPGLSFWVNASAGSGKTKVLIDRITQLLKTNKPETILCLTFSKAATKEIKERLKQSIDEKTVKKINISTVHSYCNDLLKQKTDSDINNKRIAEDFEIQDLLYKSFIQTIIDERYTLQIEEFLKNNNSSVLFEFLKKSVTVSTFSAHDEAMQKLYTRVDELFEMPITPIDFPIPNINIGRAFNSLNDREKINESNVNFIEFFLTKKNTPRARVFSKDILLKYALTKDEVLDYSENLATFVKYKKRSNFVKKIKSFIPLQIAFANNYSAIKDQSSLLDYKDLITQTLELFKKDDFDKLSYNIQFKIKHLLVDEAQDTSNDQWNIITTIAEAISHNDNSTIFIVGDEKQSIYKFQGADIRAYKQVYNYFKEWFPSIEKINLTTNYRSKKNILKHTDKIFNKNLSGVENYNNHIPFNQSNGNVHVLDTVDIEKKDSLDWPVFESYPDNNTVESEIASKVTDLISDINKCDVPYHDIMILFRNRGKIMPAIINSFEENGIPYESNSPINLNNTLIANDFLCALKVNSNVYDDLNLACFLKTKWARSVLSLTEKNILDLCLNRQGSLIAEIEKKHPALFSLIKIIADHKGSLQSIIYSIYEHYPFKNNVISYLVDNLLKRINYINLGWFSLFENIKEHPIYLQESVKQKGVKILTVHGSKGLESKNVILIDCGKLPTTNKEMVLYDPVLQFHFLRPPKDLDTILTQSLKEHADNANLEEYHRLLYVALTRAKDNLYIISNSKFEQNSWYDHSLRA